MGSTSIVAIPGVHLASGKQAFGSVEMAKFLPEFITYCKVVIGVDLVIVKVYAPTDRLSGATHNTGHAVDARSWNLTTTQRNQVNKAARMFGLLLSYRTAAQGFSPHSHGPLDVGYTTSCSYQITAIKTNGRTGLSSNGRDTDPRPTTWLRYDKGITAMKTAIAAVTTTNTASKPKPTKEEEDVALTSAEINQIALAVWNVQVTSGGAKSTASVLAKSGVDDTAQSAALTRISTQLSQIASQTGTKVDEKAIVLGVVSGISGQIRAAVESAVKTQLVDIQQSEVDTIANAVVAELSERLVN